MDADEWPMGGAWVEVEAGSVVKPPRQQGDQHDGPPPGQQPRDQRPPPRHSNRLCIGPMPPDPISGSFPIHPCRSELMMIDDCWTVLIMIGGGEGIQYNRTNSFHVEL